MVVEFIETVIIFYFSESQSGNFQFEDGFVKIICSA